MTTSTLVHPPSAIRLTGPLTGSLALALILLCMASVWLQVNPAENTTLFLLINHQAALLPTAFWAAITNLGDGFFAFAIAALLLRHQPDKMRAVLLASVMIAILVRLLKSYFGVERPPAVLEAGSFHLIGEAFRNGSFPSGHTTTVFLLATILFRHFRDNLFLAGSVIALAILAGFSRIAAGVHWPADMLAGMVLGTVCGTLALARCQNRPSQPAPVIALLTRLLMGVCAISLLTLRNGTEHYAGILQIQYGLAALLLAALVSDGLSTWRQHQPAIQSRLKTLRQRYETPLALIYRLFRFGLVGCTGFVVDMTVYSLLLFVAGIPPLVARGCAYWVSASWNWLMNRTFTFNDRRRSDRAPQWLKYLAMCLISFVPNWGTFWLLTTNVPFFAQYTRLALVAGVLAGMLFNFTIACRFIFNDKPETSPV